MSASVLVVAAHPDDEVLGCGGTIAQWSRQGRDVHVLLLADGETARETVGGQPEVAISARRRAAHGAAAVLGCTVDLLAFPDNRMDGSELLDVVRPIESVIARVRPEIVLTHFPGDVNVDHRIVHEAVLAACRPKPGHPVKTVLYFEVPSSTEWRFQAATVSFQPGVFVDISNTLAQKLKALECYSGELQAYPHPRSLRAVEALARWRGATIGVEAAEAFVLGRHLVETDRWLRD